MFPKHNGLITAESLYMFYTKIGVNETKSNDNNINNNVCGSINEYSDVIQLAPNSIAKSKVALILGPSKEVPDPYYGRQEDFENVFHLLFQACEEIAKNLKSIE